MHRARGIYIIVCILGVGLTSCTPPPTACPTCGDRIPADAGGVVDSGLLPNPVDAGAPACGPSNPCDGDLVCAEGDCVECADDRRCGTGQICRQNSCVQGCRGDVDCTQEALPVCVDVGPEGGTCGECETDNQCRSRRPGTVCREAVCVVPCRNGACDEGVCLDDVCVPCIADGDCDRGLICSENVCEEGCRDDDRCIEGQVCLEGQCTPGCRGDNNCDAGEICVEFGCVSGDCRIDDHCPEGQVCGSNRCGNPCGQDPDCGDGGICEGGACRIGCRADDACGVGQICEQNECLLGCRAHGDCGSGEICIELSCRRGCLNDDQCSGDELCIDNDCRQGCRENENCRGGQICVEETCVRQCRFDDSCGDGSICQIEPGQDLGICQPGCRDDGTCGRNAHCSEEGQCAPGCRSDAGCDAREVCLGETCVPRCDENNGFRCPRGSVCDREGFACVDCLEDDHCGEPLRCDVVRNQCVFSCEVDRDCPGGALCRGGRCVSCNDGAQCPPGLRCDQNSGCVECFEDAHCEGGAVCDPVRRTCVTEGRFGLCHPGAALSGCNNTNRRCQEGLSCLRVSSWGTIQNLCMQRCEVQADCPRGFICSQDQICTPFSSQQTLSCDSYVELGTTCNNSTRCGLDWVADDAICSGYGRYSDPPRCSWFCGSDTDCPAGHGCEDPPPVNNNDPAPRCTPLP